MDFKRSPVISDGPEYSRLTEGPQQTHWYAEGHTDPQEEREERERARSQKHEEEREKRRKDSEGKRKKASEESRLRTQKNDGLTSDEEKSSRPKDPQDLSPKMLKAKQGDSPSQSRSDQERETTGGNGNSADDESTPPSNTTRTSPSSAKGAHYIPATSIQSEAASQGQRGGQPGSSSSSDSSHQQPSTRTQKILRFLTSPPIFVFLALIFVFALFSYLTLMMWIDPNLQKIISEKMILRPSTLSQSSFRQDASMRLEVTFYNMTYTTDAEGFPHIHIQAQGPYTYLVKSSKTEVKWNSNSTVTYRIQDNFKFQPNRSVGDEDDVITTIDADVLARLSKMKVGNHSKKFHVNLTDGMVRPQTVGDILWGGSDVDEKASMTLMNTQSNESLSPFYNVYTGHEDIDRLNKMYTFNHSRADRMWPKGNSHYPMSGSADGDVFAPLVKDDQILVFFYSQTERNLLLQHEKTINIKGHKAYRFGLPKSSKHHHHVHSKPLTNDNESMPHTTLSGDSMIYLDEDVDNVQPREAFALQYLRRDSPFLVSFEPHTKLGSKVNSSDSCKMHLDIHPASGMTMRKRLCHQMSLPVVYPGHKGKGIILPVMWVDWFYESVPDDLDQVMTSYNMLHASHSAKRDLIIVMTTASIFGVILICISVVMRCRCGKKAINYELMAQGQHPQNKDY